MEIIRVYNIQNIGFTSIKQLVLFNSNQTILFILSTLEPSANNFSKLLLLFLRVRIKDVNMLWSKY